jgi:hypothetical protein
VKFHQPFRALGVKQKLQSVLRRSAR